MDSSRAGTIYEQLENIQSFRRTSSNPLLLCLHFGQASASVITYSPKCIMMRKNSLFLLKISGFCLLVILKKSIECVVFVESGIFFFLHIQLSRRSWIYCSCLSTTLCFSQVSHIRLGYEVFFLYSQGTELNSQIRKYIIISSRSASLTFRRKRHKSPKGHWQDHNCSLTTARGSNGRADIEQDRINYASQSNWKLCAIKPVFLSILTLRAIGTVFPRGILW